jgi:DNA-directed RNA polymerase specialized sigma24 family protein
MANGVPPRRPADDGTVPASGELLRRARDGDSRALSTLLRRQRSALTRWARGRLPRWARHVADTADLVQDALLNTFRRIDRFDDRGARAAHAHAPCAGADR